MIPFYRGAAQAPQTPKSQEPRLLPTAGVFLFGAFVLPRRAPLLTTGIAPSDAWGNSAQSRVDRMSCRRGPSDSRSSPEVPGAPYYRFGDVMLTLSLQPDRDEPKTEFDVIWTSDDFGARRVGRISRKAKKKWKWQLDLPTTVPGWAHGVSRDQVTAMASFRLAFESFHRQTSDKQLVEAFEDSQLVISGPLAPTE